MMRNVFICFYFCFIFLLPNFVSAEPSIAFMVESADGRKVIAVTDHNNKHRWQIHGDERWHLYPALSANGHFMAYSAGTSSSELGIYIKNLKTGDEHQVTPPTGRHLHATFSGDGKRLAYSHNDGQKSQIRLVSVYYRNGIETSRAQVIETEGNAYFPNLSSDGRYLIFQHNLSSDHKQIVRHDLKTGSSTVISDEKGVHMSPALSFDDRQVAYSKKIGGIWDIFITDVLTGKTHQVTDSAAHDFAPSFRPDGKLVFASNLDGHFELYIKDWQNEHGKVSPLVKGESTYYAPSVSGELNMSQGKLPDLLAPARSSFGAVAMDDKVYIVGGHQGPEHTYPPESFLSQLEVFDNKTKEWQTLTPRPIAAHGYGIVAHKHYIYAFGGFTFSESHTPGWKSVPQIDRYDTLTDTWETVGELAKPRSSNAVVKVGNKAYLVAGWDSTPKHEGDKEGHFHRSIEIFNLDTEILESTNFQLPDPLRRAVSAVTVGDKIILLGGISQGAHHFTLVDSVTQLYIKTGEWSELPKLPFATFAPAAGVIESNIYLFGGMTIYGRHNYDYVNHAYQYNTQNSLWQHTGRYLDETKGFSQVVSLTDKQLGILGGHSYLGGDAPVATFETFGID